MKNAIVIIGVIVLIGAAFWGGTVYAGSGDAAALPVAADGTRNAGGPGSGFGGGPMANLSEEERLAFQNMTDEERQAFMEEQGVDLGAAPGGMRGSGGGLLEGEIIDIDTETLTLSLASGGSQTIYTDDSTIISYAQGAADIAAGSEVLIFAIAEADSIQTAQAIVVK